MYFFFFLKLIIWNIDIHTCLLDSTFLCPHLYDKKKSCLLISVSAVVSKKISRTYYDYNQDRFDATPDIAIRFIITIWIICFKTLKRLYYSIFSLYACFVDLLCFFFWSLCCLSFFDIRIMITPLASSNSSYILPEWQTARYYIYLSFVGAYWIFSGVVVVGMIFLFFTLPETKDKQLEEVETLFETPWCVCGKSGSFEINLSSIKQM